MSRRIYPLFIVVGVLTTLLVKGAWTHPPDLFSQTHIVTLRPNQVELQWSIRPSPPFVSEMWQDADHDGDGYVDTSEATAWARSNLTKIELSVDGRDPISWQLLAVEWPTSQSGLET